MIQPLSLRSRRLLAAATAATLLLMSGCSGEEETSVYGPRVMGSAVASSAPTLGMGDSWDVLGAPGTDDGIRSYAVERSEDQTGEIVSVTAQTKQSAQDDGIKVAFSTPSGDSCHSTSDSFYAFSPKVLLSALASSRIGIDDACLKAKRIIVTVSRTGKASEWLDLRIRRTSMPKADPAKFAEPPEKPQDLKAPSLGASSEAQPGEWFSDAQDVSGKTLRATVGTRKRHVYKTPIEWGQGLSVQVSFDVPPSVEKAVQEKKLASEIYVFDSRGRQFDAELTALSSFNRNVTVSLKPAGYREFGDTPAPGPAYIVVTSRSNAGTTSQDGGQDTPLSYSITAAPYGEPNPDLGPELPAEAAPPAEEPNMLMWSLFAVGVVLIAAGMAQVTLHRQRSW